MKNEILDDIIEKPKSDFAGFGLRLGAYLIDIIPIIILLNILIYLIFGLSPINSGDSIINLGGQEFEESKVTRAIVRYLSFLVWIIYCTIMEASSYEGTFGKKMVGIKVTDENGSRLTTGKSITRNLTKIISYIAIVLGFIWVLFDKERRGWHDMIAKTYVVKKNEAL
ncbi:MAG: RDD family protein [Bacteroidota bacterium]